MDWYAIDRGILEWLHAFEALTWPLLVVTHLATYGGVWAICALVLLVFGRGRDRRTGIAMAVGFAVHVAAIETLLKDAVGRERPFAALGLVARDTHVSAESFSFPSGHATASFLCAWLLAARYPRWRGPLFALAGLIAVSRVHLAAHYPSDVVAGALVGCGLGFAMVRAFRIDTETESPSEPAS